MIKAMRIGEHTYGYFNDQTEEFSCTHGGWEMPCTIINENTLSIHRGYTSTYEFIDTIPEDYIR